jgi:predicted RNA-binding Zn-ribbon protein involved in translation (DUF1610 family)
MNQKEMVENITRRTLWKLQHPCLGAFAGQPTKGNLASALVQWAKSSPTTLLEPLVRANVPGGHVATSPSPSPSPPSSSPSWSSPSISLSPSSLSRSASPSTRHCPFCGARHQVGDKSCRNCGRFLHQKVRKDIAAIGGLPPTPARAESVGGFSSSGNGRAFRVGDVIRLSDDRPAKLLWVGKDVAHVLLLPDRTTITIPITQIETDAVVPRPGLASGTQGAYDGAPKNEQNFLQAHYASREGLLKLARQTIKKGEHSRFHQFMKQAPEPDRQARCRHCGAQLLERHVLDGSCPQCGADLTDSTAVTSVQTKAAGGTLEKRWSGLEHPPGSRVRHKKTNTVGVVPSRPTGMRCSWNTRVAKANTYDWKNLSSWRQPK